jgi:hypothetical protein
VPGRRSPVDARFSPLLTAGSTSHVVGPAAPFSCDRRVASRLQAGLDHKQARRQPSLELHGAVVAGRRRKSLKRGNDLGLKIRDRRERLIEARIADFFQGSTFRARARRGGLSAASGLRRRSSRGRAYAASREVLFDVAAGDVDRPTGTHHLSARLRLHREDSAPHHDPV